MTRVPAEAERVGDVFHEPFQPEPEWHVEQRPCPAWSEDLRNEPTMSLGKRSSS